MNLLRSMTTFSWGADTEIGMRLYKAVIRPKIDYGCIVYGSASETTLRSLDVVVIEATRITSRAFKTTPVSSMQIMNSEAPLHYCCITGSRITVEILLQVQVSCAKSSIWVCHQ